MTPSEPQPTNSSPTASTEREASAADWQFTHNQAVAAAWLPGLREIFDYRDLGVSAGTKGDYVAHVIKANGASVADEVQSWHVHDCTFQLVYVLAGSATFEYADVGVRTLNPGDCVLQTPGIAHREISCTSDFSVLEIVAPANFETRVVPAPT